MRVFKYRGGDKKTIERDLKLIEKNSFWGSNFSQLNDPCETLISLDEFKSLTTSFVKLLGGSSGQNLVRLHEALGNVISRSKEVGIYSLSQTYSDELLWAHYGNSHKGFCIEYDLELLLECYPTDKVYSFPVTYSKHPPEVNVADLSDKEGISIIKKLTGNKSLKRKYEKEHRIIIDRSGEYIYNHHALKAIYFGLRMDDLMKERMMTRLKDRGIDYYQIAQVEGKYQFERKKVPDKNGNEITYLCQVPKSKKRKQEVHYNIIEKDFNKFNGKATITIQLGSKLDSNELTWLANTIKDHVFWKADMIFISFILEGMTIGDGYWAVANLRGENLDVSINGLTLEQEEILSKKLKNELRKTIGVWIDDSPFLPSGIILLENEGQLRLEKNYFDGSQSTEKLKSTQVPNGVKYENYEGNECGEYFIVEKNGNLKYFSQEGIFKELKPFDPK